MGAILSTLRFGLRTFGLAPVNHAAAATATTSKPHQDHIKCQPTIAEQPPIVEQPTTTTTTSTVSTEHDDLKHAQTQPAQTKDTTYDENSHHNTHTNTPAQTTINDDSPTVASAGTQNGGDVVVVQKAPDAVQAPTVLSIPVGTSLDAPDVDVEPSTLSERNLEAELPSPQTQGQAPNKQQHVEEAVIKIQALVRGHLARKALKGSDGPPVSPTIFLANNSAQLAASSDYQEGCQLIDTSHPQQCERTASPLAQESPRAAAHASRSNSPALVSGENDEYDDDILNTESVLTTASPAKSPPRTDENLLDERLETDRSPERVETFPTPANAVDDVRVDVEEEKKIEADGESRLASPTQQPPSGNVDVTCPTTTSNAAAAAAAPEHTEVSALESTAELVSDPSPSPPKSRSSSPTGSSSSATPPPQQEGSAAGDVCAVSSTNEAGSNGVSKSGNTEHGGKKRNNRNKKRGKN